MGRNIRLSDLAREFDKLADNMRVQALEVGVARLRDRVAGLHCEEHNRFADVNLVETDDRQQRLEVVGCCRELRARVEAALAEAGAQPTSGGDASR